MLNQVKVLRIELSNGMGDALPLLTGKYNKPALFQVD